jgi:hypothetical protein
LLLKRPLQEVSRFFKVASFCPMFQIFSDLKTIGENFLKLFAKLSGRVKRL